MLFSDVSKVVDSGDSPALHLKTMMSQQDLLIVGVIEGIEITSVNWCEIAAIRMKGK